MDAEYDGADSGQEGEISEDDKYEGAYGPIPHRQEVPLKALPERA